MFGLAKLLVGRRRGYRPNVAMADRYRKSLLVASDFRTRHRFCADYGLCGTPFLSKPAAPIGNYCSNSSLDKDLLFGSLRETHNLRTYAMLTSRAKNLHPRQLPAWTSSTEQKPAGGSTFDPAVAQKVRTFGMSAHMSWQLEGRYCIPTRGNFGSAIGSDSDFGLRRL